MARSTRQSRPVLAALAALLSLATLCGLVGCDETRELTQVTARVYVEPQVSEAMQSVRIRVSTKEGELWTESELVLLPADEIETFPFEVPITPRDGDAERIFEVVIDALDDQGEALVQARAITGFVEGEVRILELWLEVCGDREFGDLCESDQGCYGSVCAVCFDSVCIAETPFTSPSDLLPLDPGERLDPDKPNPQRRDVEPMEVVDGGMDPEPPMDAATMMPEPPDPCADGPCDNGGTCTPGAADAFECTCPTGFLGDTCEIACDVSPAAGVAGDDEVNHVRDAALFMSSHRTETPPATCGTACASLHAADGERCGDTSKAPVAQPATPAGGERFIADWSVGGARRIDRIEIYNVLGGDSGGLGGAAVFIDGFQVGIYPDDAPSHVILFDPPLYGSSVEVAQADGAQPMGLAEVEVWGEDDGAVVDVALHGAVRQSSVLTLSEAKVGGGSIAPAGATNAVDGRAATSATTKSFVRAGSVALENLVFGMTTNAYPYGSGNVDEAPLIGNDNAWWYLDLGRPQRVRALQIHRGDTPTRLAGAAVYLVVDGVLEARPRWTLPTVAAGAYGEDRLAEVAAVDGVTGVKIVSALPSGDANAVQDPDASLELREVRVWADAPSAGSLPLRDLTLTSTADMRWDPPSPDNWPAPERSAGAFADGDLTTGSASTRVDMTWMTLDFGAAHEITWVEITKHPGYPGDFYYSPPGGGCPSIPLCGDTYGTCSRRSKAAELSSRAVDGTSNGALATLDSELVESFASSATDVHGVRLFKAMQGSTVTPACQVGYQDEQVINLTEVRVLGYPTADGPAQLNHARSARGATATLSPAVMGGGQTFPAERAINGWHADYAATEGTGGQTLTVTLRRPVRAETIRVLAPMESSVDGAALELLVDGGYWVAETTLAAGSDQQVALDGSRLIAAVRLLHQDVGMQVGELQVLAPSGY